MQSALQKPGAVPLLALLIFSLLSLVPTLAKEWNLYGYSYSAHLAYLGLPSGDSHAHGRYSSPRVKNASSATDSRSRLVVTGSHCRPWFFGDFYSSCIDNERDARPHHSAVHMLSRSSFEAGVEAGNDPATYSATKGPSSITRGVTAFKEFVIKRWDDHLMAQPLPPRHGSADRTSAHTMHATPTLTNPSLTPASSNGMQHQPTPDKSSDEVPAEHLNVDSRVSRLLSAVLETWQQVCLAGGLFLESLTTPSPVHSSNVTLIPKYPAPHGSDKQTHPEQAEELDRASTRESLNTNPTHSTLTTRQITPQRTLLPNSLEMTAGQSKYAGFRRDSDHMCGSSMAIVIALVVGIMWF
ncbi:hypothetical protein BDW75DRAFT_70168 [Aspergillus navahoensis]